MKRIYILVALLIGMGSMQAQPQQKTRNIAKTDAASVSERSLTVRYLDGLKAFHNGNFEEAKREFTRITLDQPHSAPSYFMLSKISVQQKNLHEATQHLQQAIKLDKNNIWYKKALAEVYMEMEEWEKAAKLWEVVCKEKNNNEYYLVSLAECYYMQGRLDKVIETYTRVEELLGVMEEITSAKVAIWLQADRVKDAAGEYEKLIRLFPHNADYYVKAGDIYQSNGMMKQAIAYYEKALELNASDPKLNLTLASYWELSGDRAKQMQYLKRAFGSADLPIESKLPYMRQIMTKVLAQKDADLMREAEQLADLLMKTHPTESAGYATLASIYLMQQKYAETLPLYEKAMSVDNTSFALWSDYCMVLKRLDRLTELQRHEQEITELFPQNAEMLCNLGLSFLQTKQTDKAIQYLNQAKAFAYDTALQKLIYTALGQSYREKGDTETADEYLRKAQKIK